MSPRNRALVKPLAVALLLGSLGVAVTAPAMASPAAIQVCNVCGEWFVDAAERNDVDLTLEKSTAHVRVFENGTMAWTVRNHVGPDRAVDHLRERPALAAEIARNAMYHDGRQIRANVSADGVVTIRYRLEDVAQETPGGALYVSYFRGDPGVYRYYGLGADRLTVVGPEGTLVAGGVAGARVDGRTVTFTSFDYHSDGPFVVFAPAGATVPALLYAVAALDVVGWLVIRNVAFLLVLPGLITAALLRGTSAVVDVISTPDARTTGLAVAAIAAAFLPHPLYADLLPFINDYVPILFGGAVAVTLLGLGAAKWPSDRVTVGFLVGAAVLAFLVGAAAVLVVPALGVPGYHTMNGPVDAVRSVLPAFPALLVLPAGFAAGRPRREQLGMLGLVGLSVGLVLAVLFGVLVTSYLWELNVIAGIVYAVAIPALGAPLFLLGRSLTSDALRTDQEER